MKIEIKSRWDDKRILLCGEYESIKDCLEKNRSADLTGAYLRGANLEGADLTGANLEDAYLRGAYLTGANLMDAKYKEPLFLPDIYSLKLLPQDTVLTFWKYCVNGKSPYQYVVYEVGKEYKFTDVDSDEQNNCGKGGNVATLVWCLKDNIKADEVFQKFLGPFKRFCAEVGTEDVACQLHLKGILIMDRIDLIIHIEHLSLV